MCDAEDELMQCEDELRNLKARIAELTEYNPIAREERSRIVLELEKRLGARDPLYYEFRASFWTPVGSSISEAPTVKLLL